MRETAIRLTVLLLAAIVCLCGVGWKGEDFVVRKNGKSKCKDKYRNPSPFDFAQGQDDDVKGNTKKQHDLNTNERTGLFAGRICVVFDREVVWRRGLMLIIICGGIQRRSMGGLMSR
jgi:hypothetical protein